MFRRLRGFTDTMYMENCRYWLIASRTVAAEPRKNSKGHQWRNPVVSNKKAKASTTLPGKVEKVIQPHPGSGEPEKAQIGVEGADHLYREIRVPNRLTDEEGQKVKLKEGAEVEVKIESDAVVTNGAHGAGEHRPSHRP